MTTARHHPARCIRPSTTPSTKQFLNNPQIMNNKSQAIALGAGITGVAAIVGAAPFIVATGCALIVREAFRDSKEYEADSTTINTYSSTKAPIDYNNIRF